MRISYKSCRNLDGGMLYHKESKENRDELLFMQADNLGSIRRIYGKTGSTVFEATYDAWGQRTVTKDSIDFRRGYTGHEHLAEFGLINMNGRLYLPLWLFGEYELQIVRGNYIFYTYIEI